MCACNHQETPIGYNTTSVRPSANGTLWQIHTNHERTRHVTLRLVANRFPTRMCLDTTHINVQGQLAQHQGFSKTLHKRQCISITKPREHQVRLLGASGSSYSTALLAHIAARMCHTQPSAASSAFYTNYLRMHHTSRHTTGLTSIQLPAGPCISSRLAVPGHRMAADICFRHSTD
jgi:hypothetical protein